MSMMTQRYHAGMLKQWLQDNETGWYISHRFLATYASVSILNTY
jgi:hypothetical protein